MYVDRCMLTLDVLQVGAVSVKRMTNQTKECIHLLY